MTEAPTQTPADRDPEIDAVVAGMIAAADRGAPGACTRLATLRATGVVGPVDWSAALDLLVRAAEGGGVQARGQLFVLSEDRELAAGAVGGRAGPDVWRRLRAAIDVGAWTDPAPERRPLCESPRIRAAANFVRPEVCAWLIEKARGRLSSAPSYDGQSPRFVEARHCSDFLFDGEDVDLVLLHVRERIAAVTYLPVAGLEPTQLFHYGLGQEIRPHFDHPREGLTDDKAGPAPERLATFLLYLNDDYDGGDLEFPRIGLRHKGRTGDGAYFAHIDPNGARDALSLHAGLPVTRGEKWILSQWIVDRPYVPSLYADAAGGPLKFKPVAPVSP
jgi:hypothetical protein